MTASILESVKDFLGGEMYGSDYDSNILLEINTAIVELSELGIRPDDILMVEDETAIWDDLTEDGKLQPLVKNYIFTKSRLRFDPPASTALIKVLEGTIDKLTFSILNVTDYKPKEAK